MITIRNIVLAALAWAIIAAIAITAWGGEQPMYDRMGIHHFYSQQGDIRLQIDRDMAFNMPLPPGAVIGMAIWKHNPSTNTSDIEDVVLRKGPEYIQPTTDVHIPPTTLWLDKFNIEPRPLLPTFRVHEWESFPYIESIFHQGKKYQIGLRSDGVVVWKEVE